MKRLLTGCALFAVASFCPAQSIDWPPQLRITGQFFENPDRAPQVSAVADFVMQYDNTRNAMVSHFYPHCPALIPGGGSTFSCSYYFYQGQAYLFTAGGTVKGRTEVGPTCCLVYDGFSPPQPDFPSRVLAYGAENGLAPLQVPQEAREVTWLQTPGDPPGFYPFYTESDVFGYREPAGFDGHLPTFYGQVIYSEFQPGSKGSLSYRPPELCFAPEATQCAGTPAGGPPPEFGCSLCHYSPGEPDAQAEKTDGSEE